MVVIKDWVYGQYIKNYKDYYYSFKQEIRVSEQHKGVDEVHIRLISEMYTLHLHINLQYNTTYKILHKNIVWRA